MKIMTASQFWSNKPYVNGKYEATDIIDLNGFEYQ